ncbi:MAG: hypothetical protein JO272_03985 [Pseudonocardiales bacterium]|nr:hypothetical protein [Pseudonocardiales bacterium]
MSDQEQGEKVLNELSESLGASRRYVVPHARVKATTGQPRDIRSLLHSICGELAAPRFGGERLRFRHYELIEWLMGLDLVKLSSEDRTKEIVKCLRGHHRGRSEDNAPDIKSLDFGPPRYQLLVWLVLRVLPEALFRAAVSGIVGFGGRYRWFMRQQYLAPLQSVNFLGFAERLTEGVREREDPDQINKLLVHAFLQDLRRAYSRRLWRMEGWRRTAYPVVLIDNATADSAGYRLLQLVNDVRNETGQSDSLLVVCSSDEVPQAPASTSVRRGGLEPDWGRGRSGDPVYRDPVYRAWVEALPGSRRARIDTAWDLPISVLARRSGDSGDSDWTFGPIVPRPPSRLARRSVAVGAAAMLVAAGIAGVSWQYGDWPSCGHTPVFHGQVSVRSINGECIGYSDGSFRFNDASGQKGALGQEALLHIQGTIFQQNQDAYDAWKQGNWARPYVTLVYLGSFTGLQVNPNEEAYSGEREELEGLAVAQKESINEPATTKSPLLRIVIANGGHDMEYANEAADMIGSLAARDPTMVAVIGMDESRDTTAQALVKLNKIRLPVIATTLSADHIGENSQLYLQMGAPNIDQARMIAAYSKQVLNVRAAQVYWTTGETPGFGQDFYVHTLVDDLNAALKESGIGVDNIQNEYFSGSSSFPPGECDYRGAIIFAGRWEDFSNFLGGFQCPSDQLLNVIADDSVSRYMVNPALRQDAPPTLPVAYVSKTSLITCDSLQDPRDDPGKRFYSLITEQGGKESIFSSPPCSQGNRQIAERIPIAYDAAELVLQAVEGLSNELQGNSQQEGNAQQEWDPRSIVPVAVYLEIRQELHQKPFFGVTGLINFADNEPDPGKPINRQISLLKVNSVPDVNTLPVEVFHCGGQGQANDALPGKVATMNPDRASVNGLDGCGPG